VIEIPFTPEEMERIRAWARRAAAPACDNCEQRVPERFPKETGAGMKQWCRQCIDIARRARE
jgi:hypothetical protein